MKGFEDRFVDFPDYILKITEDIWEGRQIASLHKYYSEDIVVRTPRGVSVGSAGVIASTLQTLAEFPDRVLLGEDVIWSGDDDRGMLSSHRIVSLATHLGDGLFGRASGKAVTFRTIANCHAVNNVIDDEWLVRDTGAILRQIGMTPREFVAQSVLGADGEASGDMFSSDLDQPGPAVSAGNEDAWGIQYARTLDRLMGAELEAVREEYDRAVELYYPSGANGHGRLFAERFWIALRSSFRSAKFSIHQRMGRHDEGGPPRAALFFGLEGIHDGHGYFGAPTGRPVYVMAAAHAEFGPRGIRREWVVFDEVAIWRQILGTD